MGTFVKAAIEGLDDQIDFSQYDYDGDGYVDNVYIYYAGVGSAIRAMRRPFGPTPTICRDGASMSPPTTG